MNFVRNLTLTCYGKQRRHFEILAIWWTRAVILNFLIISKLNFNILWLLDVNKGAILNFS